VYARQYNIGFPGLERLHPFDSRKYGRAWDRLRQRYGDRLRRFYVRPGRPVNEAELLEVHTAAYLRRLREPAFVANVLELPPLKRLPHWSIDWFVLRRMRWATMGTIVAAREAMKHGLAINLAGGYHHASPDHGHGFCAYADVGMAVHHLRMTAALADQDKLVFVDLDAHQGNGVCRTFFDDPRVLIYDQYNQHIFPLDVYAQRRIDCDVPLLNNCSEADYLATVRSKLPSFLDAVTRGGRVRLGIYNAGSDIYIGDHLGGMNVTADGVLERDRFVVNEFVSRGIPALVVLSGGYSRESYQLVAHMVEHVLDAWGGLGG
jgi:histone deacetylase 11